MISNQNTILGRSVRFASTNSVIYRFTCSECIRGQNGRGLVQKDKLIKLYVSEEEDLLFGECLGSGKSNYVCSVDFIAPDNPVARCNCPSRQFPCKHVLGLMYAYADGLDFKKSAVPEDIVSKRDKAENGRKARRNEKAANCPTSRRKSTRVRLRRKLPGSSKRWMN